MKVRAQRWDVTVAEAHAIQQRLRGRAERRDRFGRIRRVAGADVAFGHGQAYAAVLVFSYPDLQLVETAHAATPLSFPYVPGLLSFREGPALLQAFAALKARPDLILFDAHGFAHPRRFGLACHAGLLLDRPSVGCAKSRLVGAHAAVADGRGCWSPLTDAGETIGAALRTRSGVKPVYVSIGHRADLPSALALVLQTSTRFRLPEPLRLAHQHTQALMRRLDPRARPAPHHDYPDFRP
jgi:deoxyribonuclease V